MPDAVGLLTPILVLGVLLLLGYGGCVESKVVVPAPVCVRIRVPMGLTVTEILVRTIRPDGEIRIHGVANPVPHATEDGDNVYRLWSVGAEANGPWTLSCRIEVDENGRPGGDVAQGMFTLDGTFEYPCANFRATGRPSTGFDLMYVGLSEDA